MKRWLKAQLYHCRVQDPARQGTPKEHLAPREEWDGCWGHPVEGLPEKARD